MSLLLLRHPAVDVPQGICYGQTDVECQAASLKSCADSWVRTLPKDCEIWHSPLSRCERPIKEIKGQRSDIVSKVDARLLEMHFGSWELRAWSDIGQTALDTWCADFLTGRPGGDPAAESVSELMQRVGSGLVSAQAIAGERPIAWLTHAGVIRAALALARRTDLSFAHNWPQDSLPFGCSVALPNWPATGPAG